MLNRAVLRRHYFWPILFPMSCLWSAVAVARRRRWRRKSRYRSSLPVICVGNIHSGGSGKTPLVLAIAKSLRDFRPAILSRGYQSQSKSDCRKLDRRAADGVQLYGDEPWMMAQSHPGPIWICADRKRGLQEIERSGEAGLVILDDGFQHLRVAATINLIAIGADRDPADSYCLPLGELREPWSALVDADAVVLGSGAKVENLVSWQRFLSEAFPDLPVFVAERRLQALVNREGQTLPKEAVLGAFSGIAAPQRFFNDLTTSVQQPRFHIAFADHHTYTKEDIARILTEKAKHGVTHLVTTEKDRAKVADLLAARGEPIWFASLRHELPEGFWYFLKTRLESR